MKRGLALIGILCLVLGFQNCSQSSLQGQGDLASNDVSINMPPQIVEDGNASAPKAVTYIEIPNIADGETSFSSKAIEATPYRLVISTESGSIQLVDDANAVLENRCLSAGNLEELKTILSGSSICEAQTQDDDQICSMRYKPWYAALYVNEERVKLGEERDSCGKGRKDLCGALTDVFQAYVAHLRLHWSEMNCE
ncbi:MAG: hypothetical protein OM95_05485 [Bdellovibrio sp. ArHS]|uniref:hypothetical protein n=1 Tax=Bdellovibrio sp. ArHS TaxID=1569284 RepID=UPI0005832BBA|nr:hypothetical protein [Bdellovibrio sp. ArHS]KHD89055.1 MAG: hypothetical protein OM95_05485 [Bdellovibrio sp. ArHS]